jgi:hypothetical protein
MEQSIGVEVSDVLVVEVIGREEEKKNEERNQRFSFFYTQIALTLSVSG